MFTPDHTWNAQRSQVKGRFLGPPNKLDLVGLRNLDLKHTSQGDLMQKVLLTKLSPRQSNSCPIALTIIHTDLGEPLLDPTKEHLILSLYICKSIFYLEKNSVWGPGL